MKSRTGFSNRIVARAARPECGIALVPTLLVVAGMAIFAMALMTAVLSGKKTVNHQHDDYRLSSAVESVAILAAEGLWSDYLADQGGSAGTIDSFRNFLDGLGIADAGPGGPPSAEAGFDLLEIVDIPESKQGNAAAQFNDVNVDAMRVVRRDEGDSTQLWLTVSASTNRGAGIVNPVLNRAVQQVYTIEPEDFAGFDFALLANNVNCIFCHTSVDRADRVWNADPDLYGTFDRAKVAALETLMIRHNMDGDTSSLNDYDSDSYVAGTVYTRGSLTDHSGVPLSAWSSLSFDSYEFDDQGRLEQDGWGALTGVDFSPAGDPAEAFENLYLDYSSEYAEMVDGALPVAFPPPIPDDGAGTGVGAENRMVDDAEFDAVAADADGAITAGIMTLVDPGYQITSLAEYAAAVFVGNSSSLQQAITGNVVLSGTASNPITIDGTLAIDGDVIIQGYIKGEGTLVVRGNVYVPTDLHYLDGKEYLAGDPAGSPSGPRTFGIAQDGTANALALSAGGNILIGDYLKPSTLQADWTWVAPGKYEYVSGDSSGDWNFSLAEMSLFNRGEWAKTQPKLPGSAGEADQSPSTWTATNPDYDPSYVPRYYGFGPGDDVPIYNKGNIYYDTASGTWRGDTEVPIFWDSDKLTYVDPTNSSDPYLFNSDGTAKAVVSTVTPNGAWIADNLYKIGVEYFEDTRAYGTAMQLDGLIYTNNSIFSLVSRATPMLGRMVVNGSLVAADIGLLAPGLSDTGNNYLPHIPGSKFSVGLQLNYDERVKDLLNVSNPYQVQIKRTLWNPTANIQ